MSKTTVRKKTETATPAAEEQTTPTPANLEPAAPAAVATPAPTPAPSEVAIIANGLTNDEAAELARLEARALEIKEAKEKRRLDTIKALVAQIDGIPAQFGKNSLDEIVVMIRNRQNGEVNLHGERVTIDGQPIIGRSRAANADGTPRTGRGRGAIAAEIKSKIDADIRAARETAAVIANRHGVSVPYVQGRRKELGLVKARA